MKVRVYDIDWDVEEEDLEGNEELTIEEIKAELPQEVEVEIDYCEDEYELADRIVDAVSEKVGWLVNSYNWDIIGE